MRVITGTAKGKSLKTLDGLEVRPTVARVKEAVFSSLQFDIEGRLVLDLFAGSGQLGIEALSRGAKDCCFVDNSKEALNIINRNIDNCGLKDKATVISDDSFSFLKRTDRKFDIAFLDPPYNKGLIEKALPLLVDKMSDYGVIVCEYENENELDSGYGCFKEVKKSRYGRIFVSFYRKSGD